MFFQSAGLGLPETREEAIAGRSTGTGDLNTGTNSHKVVSQLRNPGKEIKAPLPCNNGMRTNRGILNRETHKARSGDLEPKRHGEHM